MSDPVVTPNEFTGTDIERINAAVAAGVERNARVVVPRRNERPDGPVDVWEIDEAVLLPSNARVDLDHCVIRLTDRSRDNFFRSANCGYGVDPIEPARNIHLRGLGGAELLGAERPRSTGDSAKTLGERTWGTDAGVKGEHPRGDWRNVGVLMAFVSDFSIENITIRDSHCWAVSLEYCSNGRVRDMHFDSTGGRVIDGEERTFLNQDGLDLRQGCRDIVIENITGVTGDDLVALTAIPHADKRPGTFESTMISGDTPTDGIRNIVIRNVKGCCACGHQIVRLLNTSGMRMENILVEGVVDTSEGDPRCRVALRIGDANAVWGGVTPVGDTCRIVAKNIVSRAQTAVLVAGSLSESLIADVIQHGGGEAVTFGSGPEYVRNVRFSNVCTVDADGSMRVLDRFHGMPGDAPIADG